MELTERLKGKQRASRAAAPGGVELAPRRFLLVNIFEDGCSNPGKDEVRRGAACRAHASQSSREPMLWGADEY